MSDIDEIFYLEIDDVKIPYSVRESSKVGNISIRASMREGIFIVMPTRYPLTKAHKFIVSQAEWVEKSWSRILSYRDKHSDAFLPLIEKNSVTYLGKEYQLIIDDAGTSRGKVIVEDDVIIVTCANADDASAILEKWYRKQAKAVIYGSLEKYKSAMNVEFNNVVIRDQKTRWGSCSSDGNLNFSWRLVVGPLYVLDYVVVHELCHLIEMNHSERFWSLVSRYYPEYKSSQNWLKSHGVSLVL